LDQSGLAFPNGGITELWRNGLSDTRMEFVPGKAADAFKAPSPASQHVRVFLHRTEANSGIAYLVRAAIASLVSARQGKARPTTGSRGR
jgi:hypothetical protein